ncbi:MAG TPA: hypothetical protein V6D21_01915 [Candidatus Obscuribacterales bacterium]
MGLLSRFVGGGGGSGSGKSNSNPTGENFNFSPESTTTISGQEYQWGEYYQGNFQSVKRLTPEEVEAAETTSKELKEQRQLYGRKFQADTESLGNVRAIHNSEQVHTRKRREEITSARGQAVKTGEHLAEQIAPQLHEQNERLGLAQEKGQNKIAQISEQFSRRREALQQLRQSV